MLTAVNLSVVEVVLHHRWKAGGISQRVSANFTEECRRHERKSPLGAENAILDLRVRFDVAGRGMRGHLRQFVARIGNDEE